MTMMKFEKTPDHIIWIDVETSGDNPDLHDLLEIAALMTTMDGNVIGSEYEQLLSVSNLSDVMSKADPHAYEMHEASGLWMDLWNNRNIKSREVVDSELCQWIDSKRLKDATLLFGGNSITLDRNFVRSNFPMTYSRISHQSIDVTSLSKALAQWVSARPHVKSKHRALSDIRQSIADYRWIMKKIKAGMEGS